MLFLSNECSTEKMFTAHVISSPRVIDSLNKYKTLYVMRLKELCHGVFIYFSYLTNVFSH